MTRGGGGGGELQGQPPTMPKWRLRKGIVFLWLTFSFQISTVRVRGRKENLPFEEIIYEM